MCEHKQIQSQEELRQKAMEHDVSDMQDVDFEQMSKSVEEGAVHVYHKIEDGVVGGYKKIETAVVDGYKKIENGVVDGFNKMTDKIVEKVFTREGESVEDAKKRLNSYQQEDK